MPDTREALKLVEHVSSVLERDTPRRDRILYGPIRRPIMRAECTAILAAIATKLIPYPTWAHPTPRAVR